MTKTWVVQRSFRREDWRKQSWLLATDQMRLLCVDVRLSFGRNVGGQWEQLFIQSSIVGIWPFRIRELAALWEMAIVSKLKSIRGANIYWVPTVCQALCWVLGNNKEGDMVSALLQFLGCLGRKTHTQAAIFAGWCRFCWNQGEEQ